MTKKITHYSKEFKEEAIKLALDSVSVCQAAKSLGIPEATLHSWVSKAKKSGAQIITSADGIIRTSFCRNFDIVIPILSCLGDSITC